MIGTHRGAAGVAAGLLIALPIVMQAALIGLLGMNVPSSDEWALAPFAAEVARGGDWAPMLLAQHNEHRYVTVRLLLAANVRLLGWDSFAMMYASLAVVVLTLAGLWLMLRRLVRGSVWGFVPVAWLVCGLVQYQNILWGLQIAFYFVVACAVWACLLLTLPSRRAFAAACACGVWATFSAAAGVLIWPVGALVLAGAGRGRWRMLVWLLAALGAGLVYGWGYRQRERPFTRPAHILANLTEYASFVLTLLGAPLGVRSQPAALAAGACVVAAALLCAALLARRRALLGGAHWAPIGVTLFGLGSAALLAAGRAQYDLEWALGSRYVTLTLPAILGPLLLLRWLSDQPGVGRPLYAACCALVALGLLGGTAAGLEGARAWAALNRATAFKVRTSHLWTDAELDLQRPGLQLSTPQRRFIAALEGQRLSLFRVPLDTWMLVRWQEGVPLAEILPELPVAQSFVCPVGTLRDVSVPFATYQRPNAGTLEMRLVDEQSGAVLAARTLAAADVRDNSHVFLKPPAPVAGCEGRRLRLEIAAPDARAGAAVTVWSYPAVLGGALAQGGVPLPGRELGVEINTLAHADSPG